MTTGSHTKSQLDGLFKDVYADKLVNLVPDFGILTAKIPFRNAKKIGRDFVEPVQLTNEHGFTYGQGIQTLTGIISADVDDAKVRGNSLTLQTGFSYDAAAGMASSAGAFETATKFKFRAMMESATQRIEQQLLYGGFGLGDSAASVNASATTTVITITDAVWAPGTWSGLEGARVEFYDTATKGTLVSSGADALFIVTTVDADAKEILITGTATGITALDIAIGGASQTVFFEGANGNEMVGLRSVATNAGTLYGVSGATYGLFTGNTYGAGSAALTLKKIYDAVVKPIGKGLMETVCCLVSPASFSTLANDEAALRRYNTQSKKGERGVDSIEYQGPSGTIKVVVHPMIREEEAIIFPEARAERIGSTDLTFNTPGRQDEMFQQLANSTGYECRLYSEQSLFLPCPGKCVYINNITN